jgi:hypothetical protein
MRRGKERCVELGRCSVTRAARWRRKERGGLVGAVDRRVELRRRWVRAKAGRTSGGAGSRPGGAG